MSEDLERHTKPTLEFVMSGFISSDLNRVCRYMNQLKETLPSLLWWAFIPYLPHLWPPRAILPSSSPNLNPTSLIQVSFYISFSAFSLPSLPPCPRLPAVSLLLPELLGESHAVTEAWETDDGGWDVCFHRWSSCSERVLLGWQVKCAEKWVMIPELCVSCSCALKKHLWNEKNLLFCFSFTHCIKVNLQFGPGWNEAHTADGLEVKGSHHPNDIKP